MIDEKINQKYLKKIRLFQKYNKHYYDFNKPLVTDYIFDNLKLDILNLEKKYNFLNHKDSPKNSIGFKCLNQSYYKHLSFLISFLHLHRFL